MDESMLLAQTQLDHLVCPVCHGALILGAQTVDCRACNRAYPIEDGLPILLAARAHILESAG
jgi:uncharacterized protein YbaR (Trm112 family)